MSPRKRHHAPAPRRNAQVALIGTADARRLLLDGALLGTAPTNANHRETLRVIQRLGFVQVDSINSVERAHHLILHARLDGYSPKLLTHLTEHRRALFEHWTHDASVIRSDWMHWWTHRFDAAREKLGSRSWLRERLGLRWKSVVAQVRDALNERGPLTTRDFPHPPRAGQGWWHWSPQKAALDYLWRSGEVAIHSRRGFDKVYDIAQRVHGPRHASPPRSAVIEWACIEALSRLGAATAREIVQFMHALTLTEVREWCDMAVRTAKISRVTLERGQGKIVDGFARTDWREHATGLTIERIPRLLAPFDPLIRDRVRTTDLFGFDYRFEAFVPAAKRRYGYYTMPVLVGEKIIARVEIASDRQAEVLCITRIWLEPCRSTKSSMRAVAAACHRLAQQLGLRARIVGSCESA